MPGGGPEALVVAGLVGHVGEQVPKVRLGEAEEPGFGAEAQQGLDDRQRDELGVGELRGDPDDRSVSGQLGMGLQLVVDMHVECRAKGVQIGVRATSKVGMALSNADLGRLFPPVVDRCAAAIPWNHSLGFSLDGHGDGTGDIPRPTEHRQGGSARTSTDRTPHSLLAGRLRGETDAADDGQAEGDQEPDCPPGGVELTLGARTGWMRSWCGGCCAGPHRRRATPTIDCWWPGCRRDAPPPVTDGVDGPVADQIETVWTT